MERVTYWKINIMMTLKLNGTVRSTVLMHSSYLERSWNAGLGWTRVFCHALIHGVKSHRSLEHFGGVRARRQGPRREIATVLGRVGEHVSRILNVGHVPCTEIAVEAVRGVKHSTCVA